MDLTRCLGISSSVEGVMARKEAAMNETSVETVAQRLRSVEWRQRRLQRGITMFLAGIPALARVGLICTLIGVPWGGYSFGVDVVMAQTESYQEKGGTEGSQTPSFNLQDLDSQLEQLLLEKTPVTPFETKVHSKIREVRRKLQEALLKAAASGSMRFKDLSDDLVRINDNGEVQVYVILKEFSQESVTQLEGLGLRVELTLPEHRLIQGWVLYDALEAIAADDNVQQIRPPDYMRHNSGAVNSAGDAVLQADAARSTFGVNGSGVKVCVISDGVDHLTSSVASGDLQSSPPVQVLNNPGGDEGTAMLEIIHDLAPGAALAFYGAPTSVDLVVGAIALRDAGCQVIVDDLISFGEPKFEDGFVAQTVRQLANSGIVYVTAAGNYAEEHYFGNYRRLTGQSFPTPAYPAVHNFSPSGTDIGDTFIIPPGGSVLVVLQWNNEFGASADDFDLFLYRSDNLALLARSIQSQNGSGDPIELVLFTNTTGSPITAFIAIAEYHLVSNPSTIKLNLIWDPGYPTQYVVPEESIFGHAAVNEILSVAAVNAATPTTIESYSSRGPATIFFPNHETRNVPKITAVDGVQTRVGQLGFFPSNPFFGTSAAAPHVAAIAALLWSAKPTLTSSQIVQTLTQTAVDLGAPGFDTTFGFGRVDAFQAVSSLGATLTVTKVGTGTGMVSSTPPGINCGVTCTVDFAIGAAVNLIATPDPGSLFSGWGGACDAAGNVTMDVDRACTATFSPGPDLIGTWNPVSQSCSKGKCKLKGSVRVVNQGTATAPASHLRVFLSDDAVLDPSDAVLKESKIKKLKPGRGKTSKIKVTLPLGVNAAGKYLFALVDAFNAVAELTETNNVSMTGSIP